MVLSEKCAVLREHSNASPPFDYQYAYRRSKRCSARVAPIIALLLAIACDSPRTAPETAADTAAASSAGAVADSGARGSSDTLWLFANDPADDAVRATDTEATLGARHGVENVARGAIHVGEGETVPGTVLFPRDSSRRLTVTWADTIARARPTRVTVGSAQTRWFVVPGVTLGTSLSELERLNGKPFKLTGFFWDYGGTVTGWEGGRLDSLWRGGPENNVRVWLRLSPDSAGSASSRGREVAGDRVFSSSLPAMRALNPRVYDLFVEPR